MTPSMRRMRIYGVLVLCVVIYVLYLTSTARHSQSPDFYSKTKQALDRDGAPHHPHAPNKGATMDADDDEVVAKTMASRLKEAEDTAKDNANAKSPRPENPDALLGMEKPLVQDVVLDKLTTEKEGEAVPHKEAESMENYDVEAEMNRLLKRSPIIIFSKTYCPHSKRAKNILLNKYTIVPSPFVVELDEHPQGALLQAKLAEMTGRKTVPNVLITGKSIGGGDDVAELDETSKLIDKVKSLGGKQIQKVEASS